MKLQRRRSRPKFRLSKHTEGFHDRHNAAAIVVGAPGTPTNVDTIDGVEVCGYYDCTMLQRVGKNTDGSGGPKDLFDYWGLAVGVLEL